MLRRCRSDEHDLGAAEAMALVEAMRPVVRARGGEGDALDSCLGQPLANGGKESLTDSLSAD